MDSLVMHLMASGSLLSMYSSLSVLSFSRCTTHAEGVTAGWLPLSFHRGKKLITWVFLVLAAGVLWNSSHHFLLLHFLCNLKIIRIHLLITACLEVCHLCFKPFRPSPIKAIPLQFSYVIWWEVFWEWSHENLEVPWWMHPPLWHSLLLTHSQLKELLVLGI